MKEWNRLLDYINEYIYIQEDEEIMIRHSKRANEAKKAYEEGLRLVGDDELAKWMFDIALDCVRKMSIEDRDYIKSNLNTSKYHFEYAGWIRNVYIHPAKKHGYYGSFFADHISSNIMKRIFSLVSPFYDYRNKRCVKFFDDHDVDRLMELYRDSYTEMIDKFVIEMLNDNEIQHEINDIEHFKTILREELGKEEFIRLFKEAYTIYNEKETQNGREDWYWNVNFPSVKAILFPLEAKQIRALMNLGYLNYIERGDAKSIVDCRDFIDKNIGLRDDYAEFMAQCGWEVCSPYYNGTWGTLSLYSLDLDYGLRCKLEEQKINTVGELCKTTSAKLLEIPDITKEETIKIKSVITQWLKERNLSLDNNITSKSPLKSDFKDNHIIDFRTFLIHSGDCAEKGHDLEGVIASIFLSSPDGQVQEVRFRAKYCRTCKHYYITKEQFKNLKKKGNIMCMVLSADQYEDYINGITPRELKEESKLHMAGYNLTSGLTKEQRRKILVYSIESGWMTKNEIIGHLTFLIKLNEHKSHAVIAVEKWRGDRDFLVGYNSSGTRIVGIKYFVNGKPFIEK